MARMANAYRVIFRKAPQPGASFKWEIKGQLVTAMTQDIAVRLARITLELDDTWLVRTVEDLGKWNKCKELMQ